nr:hypothetical protein [Tanacetum cinerariifolium]
QKGRKARDHRPMTISESASWDRGHSTWGGRQKEIVLRLWNLDKFSFNVILFDEKLLPDLAFLVASDLVQKGRKARDQFLAPLPGRLVAICCPKGERFLIASRFPTPSLACAFFSPGATVTGPHETFHCQPLQYTLNHPIINGHNNLLSSRTTLMEQMTQLKSMCEMVCQIIQKKQEEKRIEEEQAANAQYWKILACCDDNDDYNSAITPNEPVDSLSMGDEHIDTISATESDEVIKSSVKYLVPIPSESEDILDTMCDVHLVNNPTHLEAKDHFEIVINSNDDISSSDDDSLYNENIEYVEASPHDSELVSLEVAEIVIPEEKEIEDDNLREKLLNVHLLIANIEALKDNPTLSS